MNIPFLLRNTYAMHTHSAVWPEVYLT